MDKMSVLNVKFQPDL